MVARRRKLSILLVTGLLLGTLVAPALATPPKGSLPKWKPHKAFLRRLDHVVGDVHSLAVERGLEPGTLQGMSPVQLTGSSVYRLPAFARRGQLPTFEDFDMRMVGVTLPELKTILQRRFPEIGPEKIKVEPSYMPGVLHVQVPLHGRQLDLSLYESAQGYLKPHQSLTMAALKLNLNGDSSLRHLLPRLTSVNEAMGLRAQKVLFDPGEGIEDAQRGLARTYDVPGMDPVRKPEGLLHAAYWIGKTKEAIKIESTTMDEFRRLTPEAMKEFFQDEKLSVAVRRRNYVFSTLRVRDGREPLKVISMLKDAEALPKLFPGMEKVLEDPQKWEAAQQRVRNLNNYVRRSLKGKDIRKARELVLAALLSEVDDIDVALGNFKWAPRTRQDDFSKQRIVDAWKWFRKSGPPPAREQ
jgi:hypothetical protein